MALSIATCTYHEYRPDMGMPVRSTVGNPKWFSYFPYGVWENITPRRWMLGINDRDEFRTKYRHHLHKMTLDRLLGDAHALQEELAPSWEGTAFTEQLVILCYDNLAQPDMWCHRTFFAEWMGEHNVIVPELGRTRPEPPNDNQGQLW